MHGLSCLGIARAISSTTAASPPSTPRFRHGHNKSIGGEGGDNGGGFNRRGAKHNLFDKLVLVLISAVFKRKGVLLLAQLLYISVMLLYMGSLGFDIVDLKSVVVVHKHAPPSSVYRSSQVFKKLWPFMKAESNATDNVVLSFLGNVSFTTQ